MKPMKTFILLTFMIPSMAFAQESPQFPVQGFEWVSTLAQFVLNALASVPAIGGWLAPVAVLMGMVAAVLTVLSAAAVAVFKLPQVVAKWAHAPVLAAKIEKVAAIVLPWLMYLSMFNVQKKSEEKK